MIHIQTNEKLSMYHQGGYNAMIHGHSVDKLKFLPIVWRSFIIIF